MQKLGVGVLGVGEMGWRQYSGDCRRWGQESDVDAQWNAGIVAEHSERGV